MKNFILLLSLLVLGAFNAVAQDFVFVKGPDDVAFPQLVGFDVQYPGATSPLILSSHGEETICNAGLSANVFYERGSLFRFKVEAGATMLSPADAESLKSVPSFGATVLVGYPFFGIKRRTYILGYFGAGLAVAPQYGFNHKMLFEFRLSHYITSRLGVNALARLNGYGDSLLAPRSSKNIGAPVFAFGAGLSYQL